MSLQTKFAALLALLGLTVIGGLATALWTFGVFTKQVSEPITATAVVLQSLAKVKRACEGQSALVRGEPRLLVAPGAGGGVGAGADATPVLRAELEAFRREIEAELERLRRSAWYEARVGKSTARNLEARLREGAAAVDRWAAEPSAGHRAAAEEAMYSLHELIERIEVQILNASPIQVGFEQRMKVRLTVVLVLALVAALLVAGLGLTLVRRWVLRPVADLRLATARIAAGEFDHRIPVHGNDELGQLSAEVNHMAGMVRSMQEERVERERLAAVGEMVRRLAHNLRNPLAGIRGLAELTRVDLPAGSDLRENQERIISAVDRFEGWLKELLGATSPLAVHPEPTPIRAWLEGVVDAHRPMGQLKGVRVELDQSGGPKEAVIDPRHLEQALVALITNAIDASPEGGRVEVRTFAVPEQRAWEVAVADQGAGVPPELVDRIFKPYFTTKRDGNGIGLAVAQQVVKAHGGRILVESGLGASGGPAGAGPGAGFRVRLPIDAASPNGEPGGRRP